MTSRTLNEQLANIRGEIIESAQSLGIDILELSYEDAAKKSLELMTKFAGSGNWTFPWEHLIYPYIATYTDGDGNAYKLISNFFKDNDSKVYMLFNEDEERAGFEFRDGAGIVPILDECLSFEFYLTNQELDYFICFNHHDYLVTAGTAAIWLLSLLDENRELIKPLSEIINE
jgi:hypothetical protein